VSVEERMTVNLNRRGKTGLTRAMEATGDTKTDIVNRALKLYGRVTGRAAQGDDLLLRDSQGQLTQLLLF
jgi:hypothetical protein